MWGADSRPVQEDTLITHLLAKAFHNSPWIQMPGTCSFHWGHSTLTLADEKPHIIYKVHVYGY